MSQGGTTDWPRQKVFRQKAETEKRIPNTDKRANKVFVKISGFGPNLQIYRDVLWGMKIRQIVKLN